jgi:hypothetical protein
VNHKRSTAEFNATDSELMTAFNVFRGTAQLLDACNASFPVEAIANEWTKAGKHQEGMECCDRRPSVRPEWLLMFPAVRFLVKKSTIERLKQLVTDH